MNDCEPNAMAPPQGDPPWNEAERLRALHGHGILDTAAEAEHVAAATPGSAFAACLAGLRQESAQATAVAR